uniref:Uncharacterized protein n=1 Tax=Magallana gigas TaxID=29159 RepID=K1QTI1_MAGGI
MDWISMHVMELNNLPLPLKMSMDFIEDGNMIQLKFNILGYLKKEAWLCEGSDAKHSATIQLLCVPYDYLNEKVR